MCGGAYLYLREIPYLTLKHSNIRGKVQRHWLSVTPFEVEADTFFAFRTLARRMENLFHCQDGLDETLKYVCVWQSVDRVVLIIVRLLGHHRWQVHDECVPRVGQAAHLGEIGAGAGGGIAALLRLGIGLTA